MRFVLAEKINDYRPLNVPVTVVFVVTRHQKLVHDFRKFVLCRPDVLYVCYNYMPIKHVYIISSENSALKIMKS